MGEDPLELPWEDKRDFERGSHTSELVQAKKAIRVKSAEELKSSRFMSHRLLIVTSIKFSLIEVSLVCSNVKTTLKMVCTYWSSEQSTHWIEWNAKKCEATTPSHGERSFKKRKIPLFILLIFSWTNHLWEGVVLISLQFALNFHN